MPLVAAAVALLLACGCVAGSADTGGDGEAGLPEGCGLSEVRSTFGGLFAAMSDEDRAAVSSFFAPKPEQNGFLMAGEEQATSYEGHTPGAIAAYLVRRARVGERLSLLAASVQSIHPSSGPRSGPLGRPARGPSADDPVVAVGLIMRSAADGRSLRQPTGKIGLNCATGQFYVWSVDKTAPPHPSRLCGQPVNARRPPAAPVMCTLASG